MNLIPRKYYLDDFFDNFLTVPEESNMKCDIYEKDGNYYIEMDIPGFEKKDIKVECNKGYLTITAEKEKEDASEEKKYIRRERVYGKYKREFYLGDVQMENIDAEFKDGILKIMVPRKEEVNSKTSI
ncbi:MAG: Hsp20/alpha crystallin family protein, partial [Bacilli bacterium]|nr:Hsp20/alpha crystallin family protein [Bacilli bacterium]